MNTDIKSRDKIIFGKYDPNAYMGGIRKFDGLTYNQLSKLIDGDFIDIDDAQNDGPTIAELYEFASGDPTAYTFSGYTVSDRRSDYRVSIDGITRELDWNGYTGADEIVAFAELVKLADEFEITQNGGNAWWD